ncbi:hypothetical protein [Actinoallomurus sp. NPDC052274]|uniref:hypothetical protein n=1 Tax=Actinoallomurus sp. NPDC052274 TaxID=3155420 RepID=UPI003412353C
MSDQATTADPPPYSQSCASCGAATEYAPGTDVLRCPYCGHEQPLPAPTRQVREHSYAELMSKPRTPSETLAARRFVCQKCGARIQGDAVSQRCQFCTAPLVVDVASDDQVAPEAVVPFVVDRGAARAAVRTWVRSRWFAPNRLKKVSEAETMNSTYLPHWTFDANTVSHYRGERGEHYWETETYTETVDGKTETRTRQVQKTRWYPARGTVSRFFDDVLIAATSRVDQKKLGKLRPWPLAQAAPFQPGYVAGHESLRYDVEPDDGFSAAKDEMAPVIRADCRRAIGGDEQRIHSVDTSYLDVTYKLMLLPVWFASYLYGGKTWQVIVNGCSGEVQGERPYSPVKIALAVLVLLAVITAIVLLYLSHHHAN